MDNTNIIAPRPSVGDLDRKALLAAKRLEGKRRQEGWRFYNVNERLKVFVPFGEDGKPTKKGFEMIRIQKELRGIK